MVQKIGINRFGRIGRIALRNILSRREPIEVVAINDKYPADILANLFKYDTNYGAFLGEAKAEDGHLIINNQSIRVLGEKNPSKLPWKDLSAVVVLESTGVLRRREDMELHVAARAQKVLLSVPAKGTESIDASIIPGINDDALNPEMQLFSNASCTTNCVAPKAKILLDNFGIKEGFLTTIHAYTNSLQLLDSGAKNPRSTRAAAENIVPAPTGAAVATAEILPLLKGKMTGIAMRVPVSIGRITDFVVNCEKDVSVDSVNQVFFDASNGPLKGILRYFEEPLVSSDGVGTSESYIFDSQLPKVVKHRMVKVLGWYDNEWAYSARLVDTLKRLLKYTH